MFHVEICTYSISYAPEGLGRVFKCLYAWMCVCFITNCSTAKTQSININVESFGSLETSLVLAGGSLGQAQRTQL